MKKLVKLSVIRQDETNPCPFGLPIPLACDKVGSIIKQMIPLVFSKDPLEDSQQNLQIFYWESEGIRCPYAKDLLITKKSVNCTFAPPETTDAIVGSPFYVKPFSGMSFDGHTSVPLGYYTDTSIDRGMYYGMYSIESIASEETDKNET